MSAQPDRAAIRAWLGPAKLSDEQLARFTKAWEQFATDEDPSPELATTAEYLCGDVTADDIARDLATARATLARVTAQAAQFTRLAYEDGMSEKELARRLGVDRARTIRRWLGK